MGRCGCGSSSCSCTFSADGHLVVSGTGAPDSPLLIAPEDGYSLLAPGQLPVFSTVSTSHTPGPEEGQVDYQADKPNSRIVVWDGAEWQPIPNLWIMALNAPVSGSTPNLAGLQMLEICGSAVVTLDVNTNAHVAFLASFPTAIYTVVASNGDATASHGAHSLGTYTVGGFDIHDHEAVPGTIVRTNFIARGY